jgi:hypothetical protein
VNSLVSDRATVRDWTLCRARHPSNGKKKLLMAEDPETWGSSNYWKFCPTEDQLCGLVVRVPGYRSGGPGLYKKKKKKSSGSGTGSTQPSAS